MRDIINKGLTNEELLRGVVTAFDKVRRDGPSQEPGRTLPPRLSGDAACSQALCAALSHQGWRSLKLYFMIGLPGETDADVAGIAETVMWLQKECKGCGL